MPRLRLIYHRHGHHDAFEISGHIARPNRWSIRHLHGPCRVEMRAPLTTLSVMGTLSENGWLTLHKDGRRTPDPRSCVAHIAALHILGCCSEADTHVFAESTLRCCYVHAGCASWRTRAGVGGRPANLKPTPTTQTEPFNCQYTRPDRTTNSSSLSGHRSPAKYWVKVAYLETYLRKPRTTASSTRHDSRRVRHSSQQVT